MSPRRSICSALLSVLLSVLATAAMAQGTLRIGLNEDPDALDPARGGTFVGRIVFAAVCDKLIDTDAHNRFVPQLATAWRWSPDNLALTVTLRDGVLFHALLAKARGVTDLAARQAAYLHDRPHIVLWHVRWLWALGDKVSGFVPTPDGLIRPQGMMVEP